MLSAIIGKPGAGKSYEGVILVLRALEDGRVVLTNLPLNPEVSPFKESIEKKDLVLYSTTLDIPDSDDSLTRASFSSYSEWKPLIDPDNQRQIETKKFGIKKSKAVGPILILDEVRLAFDQMQRTDQVTLHRLDTSATDFTLVCDLLSKHRHFYADVYLITQGHHDLPQTVKGYVDDWIELVSARKLGLGGYTWAVYNTWYGARESTASGARKYKKKIFALYDSHAYGMAGQDAQNEDILAFSSVPLYFRWPFLFLYIGIGVFIYALPGVYSTMSYYLGGLKEDEVVERNAFGNKTSPDDQEVEKDTPKIRQSAPSDPSFFGEPHPLLPSDNVSFIAVTDHGIEFAGNLSFSALGLKIMGVKIESHTLCTLILFSDIKGKSFRKKYLCRSAFLSHEKPAPSLEK